MSRLYNTNNAEQNTSNNENILQTLFGEYINECQFSTCLRPATIKGYTAVFSLFLKIMPEVSGVETLTPAMLNEFFRRIQSRPRIVGKNTIKTGVKSSTIQTLWRKLHAFFSWLCRKKYLLQNPLSHIKSPYVSYDDFRRLADSEVQRI